MTDTDTDTASEDGSHDIETDGGVAAREAEVDYLESKINILSPSTPFMRDHLKVVWGGFLAWVVVVWGPYLATVLATESMTAQLPIIGFPAHYFFVAFVAPTGSLVLAAIYAKKRDQLDEKYGIDPSQVETETGTTSTGEEAAATDGGVDR
jgi:putative solute:sodium symporter small subunit